MPRISAARRRDREATLVDTARRVFAARGFEAASVAEIARAAGVSDGLLYRYFTDKRALLTAVLEEVFEQLIERGTRSIHAADGLEARLKALIETQLQLILEEPDVCRLFLSEVRSAAVYRGSPLHRLIRRYTALVIDIVAEAQAARTVARDIDPVMVRDLVFGGMEHIAWRYLNGGRAYDPASAAERLARLVVTGLGWKDARA